MLEGARHCGELALDMRILQDRC